MEEYYEFQIVIDQIYKFMNDEMKVNYETLKIDVILSTQIIKKESRWDNKIFLIGLELLKKMYKKPCKKGCLFCCSNKFQKYWLEAYIIALMISQKMYDDFSINNKKILYIYGKLNRKFYLDLEIINQNELYFMKHLDWNLTVSLY